MRFKFSLLTILKYCFFSLVTLLIICSIVIGVFLYNSSFRQWSVSNILPLIAKQSGYELMVLGIHSGELGEWKIESLSLKKNNLSILEIENLDFSFVVTELFKRKIIIPALSAATVKLNLNAEKKPKQDTNINTGLPKLLPFGIGSLNVDQLEINHPDLPQNQVYKVSGDIQLLTQDMPIKMSLNVTALTGVPLTMMITTQLKNDDTIVINGAVHEAKSGLIGTLLRQDVGEDLDIIFALTLTKSADTYNIRLENFRSLYQFYPVNIHANLSLNTKSRELFVKDLSLQIGSTDHHFKGVVTESWMALSMRLDKMPLGLILPWLDLDVAGNISCDVIISGDQSSPVIEGDFAANITYNKIPFNLEGSGIFSKDMAQLSKLIFRSGKANTDIKGHVDLLNKQVDLSVLASDMTVDLLRNLGLPIVKDLQGKLNVRGDIVGNWLEPKFDGKAEFIGSYISLPFAVLLDATGGGEEFVIRDLQITAPNDGKLEVVGSYKAEMLDFYINSRAIPTKILANFGIYLKSGILTSKLHLIGTKNKPVVIGTAEFDSVVVTQGVAKGYKAIPIKLISNIGVKEGILSLENLITDGQRIIGHFNISIPLELYANISHDAKLPLNSSLSADLDLAYLSSIIEKNEHEIKGVLKANLNLGGTLSEPTLVGEINLENGFYRNDISGTSLQDISALLEARNQSLTIIKASASDGMGGVIGFSGGVNWSDKVQRPINFILTAQDAALLRRKDIEGAVTGEMSLQGDFKEMLLSGTVRVRPFTVMLDLLSTQNIPEITVNEIYNAHLSLSKHNVKPISRLPVINLDINLLAENQAFVRGKGLEAELQGKVKVDGTLNNSNHSGKLQMLRGSYKVLGKKFVLESGSVNFDNDIIILSVLGKHKNKNIEVTAELSGPIDDIKLKLSSVPNKPEDEIIAYLLFGKSSQSITPVQAIMLARAIKTLKSGSQTAFDPIEMTRSFLGVDNITVDSETIDDNNEISVGVGKYVSDKVYVEIGANSNPSKPWQSSIEIEILPNLSLKNSTDANSGFGGIDLEWRRDY